MSKCGKRLATPEEVAAELELQKKFKPDVDVDKLYQEALAEGYKDEVCLKCGQVYLAHFHFVRCNEPDCPMKTPGGKSLLEMLLGTDEEKPCT
jgi:hypothetical protein